MNEGELRQKLNDVVDRLRNALSPVAIDLYGSYACGNPGPDSDTQEPQEQYQP